MGLRRLVRRSEALARAGVGKLRIVIGLCGSVEFVQERRFTEQMRRASPESVAQRPPWRLNSHSCRARDDDVNSFDIEDDRRL